MCSLFSDCIIVSSDVYHVCIISTLIYNCLFFYWSGESEVPSSRVGSGPSGYYFQGVWRRLGVTPIHQFNSSSAITQCLKGKTVHMYGDSTMRQWFEYLDAALPGSRSTKPFWHRLIYCCLTYSLCNPF